MWRMGFLGRISISPSNKMTSQTTNKSTDASETFIPPHGGHAGLLAQ